MFVLHAVVGMQIYLGIQFPFYPGAERKCYIFFCCFVIYSTIDEENFTISSLCNIHICQLYFIALKRECEVVFVIAIVVVLRLCLAVCARPCRRFRYRHMCSYVNYPLLFGTRS